jgi:hypothetical protein
LPLMQLQLKLIIMVIGLQLSIVSVLCKVILMVGVLLVIGLSLQNCIGFDYTCTIHCTMYRRNQLCTIVGQSMYQKKV